MDFAGQDLVLFYKQKRAAPILPIGFYVSPLDTLIVKGKIQNRSSFAHWQVKGCCHVNIGRSWQLEKSVKENFHHLRLREFTNRMMTQIAELVAEARNNAESKNRSLRFSH